MVVLDKELIWERLKTRSVWVTSDPPTGDTNALFGAVAERQFRFVVGIWISGNAQRALDIRFTKLKEDSTWEEKWSPIPVGPADFRQIPEGSLNIEDPVVTFEGGTRFYAQVGGVQGLSLNVTTEYWDRDI